MSERSSEVIYFIGGLFPKEKEGEIRNNSISGLQSAANNLQWRFVRGFDEHLGPGNVHIINSEYIGSYPRRYKKLFIRRSEFTHSEGACADINTGFLNAPVIKELSRLSSLKREINRIPDDVNSYIYFVGYAATYPIVEALLYAKRRFPRSVSCLIVPDLPQYMELGKKKPSFLKRVKNAVVGKRMRLMDCYVPLTEAMIPFLCDEKSKCAVVEGIADDDLGSRNRVSGTIRRSGIERYVLYTGTLQYRYGIAELLSAFQRIGDRRVKLLICGEGEAEEEIKVRAREDERIEYLGLLPSKKVENLRVGASVLVNPRRNKGDFTKFSFPSKMMEYLASGVPTVAYLLDGMPNDYRGLFIDATEIGLQAAIEQALNMTDDDAAKLADAAKSHILRTKNPRAQCGKVLSLLRRKAVGAYEG